MSLLARRQEVAVKTSDTTSPTIPAKVTTRTRARMQQTKTTQPTQKLADTTSNFTPAHSSIAYTSNGMVISLRGEELRWLLSQVQGCRGPEPTVHIVLDESPPKDSATHSASTESQWSPRPDVQPFVLHNVLDTLRTTSSERTLLESISCPDSQADAGALSCGGYPDTENWAPEAYTISADLSDTEPEWDQLTTF